MKHLEYIWAALLILGFLAWQSESGSPHVLRWVAISFMGLAVISSGVKLTWPVIAGTGLLGYLALSLSWSSDPQEGALELAKAASLWLVFCAFASGLLKRLLLPTIVVAFALALGMEFIWPETHGGFGNENWLSEWLLLASPFIVAFAWRLREKLWGTLACLLLVVAAIYVTAFTSYNGWMLVAWGLALVYCFKRRWKYGALFTILVPMNAILLWPTLLDRIISSLFPRIELWINSVALWGAAPVFGHGLGSFALEYDQFREFHLTILPGFGTILTPFPAFAGAAHNEVLQAFAEFGLIGALLIGAFLVTVIRPDFRSPAFWSLLVAGLLSLISFPLQNPATALLIAMALGVLLREAKPLTALSWKITGPTALVLVTVFLSVSVPAVAATKAFATGQVALSRSPEKGFVLLWTAYKLQPWSRLFRRELALGLSVVDRRGEISSSLANRVFRIAFRTAPYDPVTLLTRVEYLLNSGLWKTRRDEVEAHLLWLNTFAKLQPETREATEAYAAVIAGRS